MQTTSVTTKEQLEAARAGGSNEIVVIGKLADDLKRAKKVAMVGKIGLAALTAALGVGVLAAPATGGFSLGMTATATALTGVEIAAIITASALGLVLVIAIFKGYEEISYEAGRMVLRKRSTKT